MPTEPNWSMGISNSMVCTWFYALAVIDAILGIAGVLGASYLVVIGTRGSFSTLVTLLMYIPFIFINSWFLFLVCNRGLKA